MDKFTLPKRFRGSTTSVWNIYVPLALKYKPLNLGQGFPDFAPSKHVTDALVNVIQSADALIHQYTRGYGHPHLVQVLSSLYSGLTHQKIDPNTEVMVTCGAYEALFCAILSNVDVGDEVIIIEPYFDCYEAMVEAAEGTPKFIPLRQKKISGIVTSADWILDEDELENLFNEKTKLIILNTPHNPTGKVFNRNELEKLAELCIKWNVLCISDEVYEWLVFDNVEHIRICTLPGMWERTVTIGSAGKTFSVTGWKIGWAYGPANLINNLQMIHQNCVFSCATPLQEAIAQCFELEMTRLHTPECYFKSLPIDLKKKRDLMAKFLTEAGMKPIIPEGGYFMLADWSALERKIDLSSEDDKDKDYRFTKWMTKNVGLQGIPPSAFYSESNKSLAQNYVRYCFMKTDENLKKAEDILQRWK